MKQPLFFLAALLGLLISCNQAAPPVSGDSLKVTDGSSEQSYTVADMQALGAEQAALNDVTYIGVPLSLLVQEAGFDPATLAAVKATASDGFSAHYEPDLANRPDTLVAYARVNGPLAEDEGTFRMVLPDQGGKLNPRDLVEIKVYP
jgi:hypothetical protein